MRSDLIDQPSAMPTRKMLAVAIAGVIAAALTRWFDQLAALTPWLDWLASDGVKAAVPVLAAFAAGYLVRERAPAEPAKPGDWPESAARLQAAPLVTLAALGLALLMLTGCPATTGTALPPHVERLMVFTKTCNGYEGALNVLGSMRAAGILDADDGDRVIEIADFATPICSGPPVTDADLLADLERRLNELVLMQLGVTNVE